MLKESALREGQTIDAIAKILKNLITPIEEDLEKKERFAIIQEENRKAELKAKQDADKKAKAAPDKEKLITLAALINHIDLPEMKTEEGKTIIKNVNVLLGKVSTYILENTNKL